MSEDNRDNTEAAKSGVTPPGIEEASVTPPRSEEKDTSSASSGFIYRWLQAERAKDKRESIELIREKRIDFVLRQGFILGAVLVLVSALFQLEGVAQMYLILIGALLLVFPLMFLLPRMITLRTTSAADNKQNSSSLGSAGIGVNSLQNSENTTDNASKNVKQESLEFLSPVLDSSLPTVPDYIDFILHEKYDHHVSEDIRKKAISSWIDKEIEIEFIKDGALDTIVRLTREIENLGSRANTALSIGIAATLGAGAALIWFVGQVSGGPITDPIAWAEQFIPRLVVVVFIEVFAYFFLRLYRNGIYEIKYFQNEITNIEAKLIALRAAIVAKDKATTKDICMALAKTERNFLLKKGDVTMEMARGRIDQEGDLIPIDMIERITKMGIMVKDSAIEKRKVNYGDESKNRPRASVSLKFRKNLDKRKK